MSKQRTIVACSCEDTVPLDAGEFRRACAGVEVITGRQFCRSELERFRTLTESGASVTVGCTQEAPLFRQAAAGSDSDLSFVNLRETAGWSAEGACATPKMAALAVADSEPIPDVPYVHFESAGVILVYARDERALVAAELVKDHLDVTVLITRPENIAPPRVAEFPIVKGTICAAKGHVGAFEIVVDDYATPAPSSRSSLQFGPGRDGAVSHCDIVLDLSGGAALFPATDLRDGYVRADPDSPAAVLNGVLRARDLVGSFDKPRYITFNESLCAHSRSNIVGCRRCLDLCPAGAIVSAENHVVIDANICAGCGQCATVCPTGAAGYALPPTDVFIRKLRMMLLVYREAGGERPVLLFHDNGHGGALIDALARHGEGLPANVLPFSVNEVTQVGLEAVAAAFAYGVVAIRLLLRGTPRHDVAGLLKTIALAEPILSGLGLAGQRVAIIETDDPFALGRALRDIEAEAPVPRPASFRVAGGKRDVLRFTLRELHAASGAPVEVISLSVGAPFGAVEIDAGGCTLCLACVSACPTGALRDDPERPVLRFAEDACVQCGLCKATCPEQVIKLTPQLNFRAPTTAARVLKEEEPFPCIRCGKPFGVKSTIERVVTKLEGKHWMYQNSSKRLDIIKMCDDCRIAIAAEEEFNPYGTPARPNPRTTEDYLREREIESET